MRCAPRRQRTTPMRLTSMDLSCRKKAKHPANRRMRPASPETPPRPAPIHHRRGSIPTLKSIAASASAAGDRGTSWRGGEGKTELSRRIAGSDLKIAQASFLSQFPELAAIAPENLPATLELMSRQDPAKFARVKSLIATSEQLLARQEQEGRLQAERTRQNSSGSHSPRTRGSTAC